MKKRRFLFLLPLPGALLLLACCRAHPALASFWAARVFVPCARALGRVSARPARKKKNRFTFHVFSV